MLYKCKTKCFFKNRLYQVGDSYNAEKGEKVPEHFIEQSKFKIPLSKKEEIEARSFYEAQMNEGKEMLKRVGHKPESANPKPLEKDDALFK